MYKTLIKPLAKDAKTFLLDTFFPKTCTVCGKEGEFLCLYCRSTLKLVESQQCIICHKPSPFGITHPGGCKTPYAPEGLVSIFDYHDDKLAKAIIQGKYSFIEDIYKILSRLVASQIKARYKIFLSREFYLAPVPLSGSRKRWRGFNQAEVLCHTLSEELGLPIINALIRVKSTKTQKDLKKEARLKNVSEAFALRPSPNLLKADGNIEQNSIKGKNIILIDDVVTTGSTMLEAVKVLKRNGAGEVWCMTVAKD